MPPRAHSHQRQRRRRLPTESAGDAHAHVPASNSVGNNLDLEPLSILQEQRRVLRTTGMGITIGEQLTPPMRTTARTKPIEMLPVTSPQSQVVQPGTQPIVPRITHIRGLLQHDVHTLGVTPDPSLRPIAVRFVTPAQVREKPVEGADDTHQIVSPQLNVMHRVRHNPQPSNHDALTRSTHIRWCDTQTGGTRHAKRHDSSQPSEAPPVGGEAAVRWRNL